MVNSRGNKGVKILRRNLGLRCKDDFRILLLKLDHMGDLLLAVPAILCLRNKFINSSIDIVVGSWNVDIAKKLNLFRNIFVFDYFHTRSDVKPKTDVEHARAFFESLGTYEISIDLRRARDSRLFLKFIDAKLKIGYNTFSHVDNILDICLPTEFDEPGIMISSNRMNVTLQLIDLVDSIPIHTVKLPPLVSHKPSNSMEVAIFPGAGNTIKCWPVENYISLIKNLLDHDYVVSVYLSRFEDHFRKTIELLGGATVYVGLDFSTLLDRLSHCSVVVANNSFGAHLGSYIGKHVIAIFGGHESPFEWTPPFGPVTVLYSDLDCSPCHLPNQSLCSNDLLCLRQISVDMVFDETAKAIDSFSGQTTNIPLYIVTDNIWIEDEEN